MSDHEEFRAFVAARYPALVRTARLLVTDPTQAEDLTQNALLTTFVHWRSIREAHAAEAYTRTVLTRLAIKGGRRKWRGERPTADLPESLVPGDRYAGVDEADVVRRALAALPLEQRAVLVLRYYADLSEAQTAEALKCSVGTVKSRTSRALTALRASGLLEDELEAHDG
jgi:RNA polymerase sigma-70 factor (sigma-E family)